MRRVPSVVVVAVAVLAACGERKSGPEVPPCARQTAEAGADVAGMLQASVMVDVTASLPVRDDLPDEQPERIDRTTLEAVKQVPAIVLGRELTGFQGVRLRLDDDAQLRARLRQARSDADHRPLAGVPPERISIMIDHDVPWSRVARVLAAAADAGLTDVYFGFARTQSFFDRRPRPPAPIDRELAAVLAGDDAKRTAGIGELTARVIAPCPPLVEVFAEHARDGGFRPGMLANDLRRTLRECDCRGVDVPSLRALLHHTGRLQFPASTLRIILAGDGQPLTAAPDARWGEISRTLRPGARVRVVPTT